MSKKSALLKWRISRIKGSKAEQLGVVAAKDATAAIIVAIKEFNVKDVWEQQRLAARPDA